MSPAARNVAGTELFEQAPLTFVADARLSNRNELGAMLSLSPTQRDALSDCALLMRLFHHSGPQGIARALGAFAFAAWNEKTRCLELGRDCLGERALFYHVGAGFVAFATELNALLAMPIVPRAIDEDALANFLVLNLHRPGQSLYRGIERVPSRTVVTIDRGGARSAHYWSPDFQAAPPYKRDEDYVLRARELFDQAVLRATVDTPRVAISLSGGLDSSAVAATAARLGRARSIKCYTLVPPRDAQLEIDQIRYLSERNKVEALARMHPALDVEFCEEGALHPFEQDPVRFFVRAGTPIRNASNLGTFGVIDDRIRQAGHLAKMTGSRGNIGLSWTGRYSLLTLLRQGMIGGFVRDFAALSRLNGRGPFKTLASDVLLPTVPRWLRRMRHRVRGDDPHDISHFSYLNPTALRDLDLARAWREEGFGPWGGGASEREPAKLRARLLFDANQIGRDYYAASRSIHGFETRDPHADRTLLEFLLRVPEPLYRKGGIARSFAREVLADRLPEEIIDETRKGYQGVTWFKRMDIRRQDIADEIERLAASPLASRMLDLPGMKRVLDNWPKDGQAAELRRGELRRALTRGIHVGRFIRWVEGGNA